MLHVSFKSSHICLLHCFSFVRPRVYLFSFCQDNCARHAWDYLSLLGLFVPSLTKEEISGCLAAHALPWPKLLKTNAFNFAWELLLPYSHPLAQSLTRSSFFELWCSAVTWGGVPRMTRFGLVLLILPATTALSPSGLSIRFTISPTPGGYHRRLVGSSFVVFPFFNVMSIRFVNSVSALFNFVPIYVPFEISPCIQGCVFDFAVDNLNLPSCSNFVSCSYFKFPTQVHPDFATVRLLTYEIRHALHSLVVHLHISMRASLSRPWCPTFVCCHPYALYNSFSTPTTDTSYYLLVCNLLVTASTSWICCFNFERVGVSRSSLNFRGSRQFSV